MWLHIAVVGLLSGLDSVSPRDCITRSVAGGLFLVWGRYADALKVLVHVFWQTHVQLAMGHTPRKGIMGHRLCTFTFSFDVKGFS